MRYIISFTPNHTSPQPRPFSSPPNPNERSLYTPPLSPEPHFRENPFRSRVQLGRAPGLVGRVGRRPLARRGGAIRRRRVLDARVRQHLRAPGQGGRRPRRHPLDGAPVWRAHALHSRRLLRILDRLHRACGLP